MKFGEHFKAQQVPEWEDYYVPYSALKKLLSAMEKIVSSMSSKSNSGIAVLISSTDAAFVAQLQDVGDPPHPQPPT